MLSNKKISIQQLAVLVVFAVIGDSILIVPSITALAAQQDAWISGFLGLVVGVAIMGLLLILSGLFPKETIIQIGRRLLGPWGGSLLALLLLVHFMMCASAIVREVGDFTVTQMLPDTPIRGVLLLLAIIILVGLSHGIETIARVAELFFPWLVITLLLLICFLLPEIKTVRLQPVLEHGVGPVVIGTLYTVSFPFAELYIFLMLLPYVKRGKHLNRDFLIGAGIGGFAIAAIIMMSVLVLGPYLTGHHNYPTYALAQTLNIGNFVERLEAILSIIWIITSFFKAVLYCYAFMIGMAQLFKFRDGKILAPPICLLLFGLSIIITPNTFHYNYTLERYWPFWDFTYAVLMPLFLIAVYYARRPGQRNRPADSS